MRAESRFSGATWELEVLLDAEDEVAGLGQWDIPIELTVRDSRVHLPVRADPHPDLVALAILLVVRPWVRKALRLATPVSHRMAEAVASAFGIEVGPVDPHLAPRPSGTEVTTALSLGPDCLAGDVLLDLPKKATYFVRVPHPSIPNRATHIRHDVIVRRLEHAVERGWKVDITRSDLEFMAARPFPTFAHWPTMFIGAILTADEENLGYIVSGRHLAGHYVHSGQRYDTESDHDLRHREVFGSAGLELVSPVASLTEVGTAIVARHHQLFDLSSSCLLSTSARGGCGRCDKCFRKELMQAWVEERAPNPEILLWAECDRTTRFRFERFATTQQPHAFAFLASRLKGLERSFLARWVGQFEDPVGSTDWVAKFYPRGISDWVPVGWQPKVSAWLSRHLEAMSEEDIRIVESWPQRLLAGTSQLEPSEITC